jgi:hypothetical protein
MPTFIVKDHEFREITVSVEDKQVKFSPVFHTIDGGCISYINGTNFTTYYAPDVAESVDAVWMQCWNHPVLKKCLGDILQAAKESVQTWEIRDSVDQRDQKRVLDCCSNRHV